MNDMRKLMEAVKLLDEAAPPTFKSGKDLARQVFQVLVKNKLVQPIVNKKLTKDELHDLRMEYDDAVDDGYRGSFKQWIAELQDDSSMGDPNDIRVSGVQAGGSKNINIQIIGYALKDGTDAKAEQVLQKAYGVPVRVVSGTKGGGGGFRSWPEDTVIRIRFAPQILGIKTKTPPKLTPPPKHLY